MRRDRVAGVDVSFHNDTGTVEPTPYRERTTFNPFGPVDNGAQCLFGLDYRTAAWRTGSVPERSTGEEDPFHTEVGYWLWDGNAGQVMRGFTMRAEVGSETYGILSNQYLAVAARTILYEVTVTVEPDTFSYEETTTVEIARTGTTVAHTDRNTLRRVG